MVLLYLLSLCIIAQSNEWLTILKDFHPDLTISFELEQEENLFEEIKSPTKFRGAYFTPLYMEGGIEINIITPSHELIYNKYALEGVFQIDAKEVGEYQFRFINKGEPIVIVLTLDIQDHDKEHLTYPLLNNQSLAIENIYMKMNEEYYLSKISELRNMEGYRHLNKTHEQLLFYSQIEIIGVICINLWQIYQIKRLLGDKRII